MDIYTFGGGPENLEQTPYVAFEENFLVPIDLTGFDTTKISEEFTSHPLGMLAVVMDTHSNERAIVPARGPYGVMYSDRLLLASSTGDLEDSRRNHNRWIGYPILQLRSSAIRRVPDAPRVR